ncbi:hypothetical protein JTE90_024128, partial [Oedothorax gibbosus]
MSGADKPCLYETTMCVNIPGSYRCDCKPGYQPLVDGGPDMPTKYNDCIEEAEGDFTRKNTWTSRRRNCYSSNSEVYSDEIEFDNNTFVDNVPLQSDCDCGLFAKSCSYVEGKKKCICEDLYADKQGTCEACNCNGKYGCEFYIFGLKECKCPKGYAQLHDECRKCDCGEHGKCKLYDFGKLCECEKGYKLKTSVVYSGICEECDCGENGGCEFNRGYKECTCKPGFAENYRGKCEECDCNGDPMHKDGFLKCQCPKVRTKEGLSEPCRIGNPLYFEKRRVPYPEENDCDPLPPSAQHTGRYD